MVGINVIRWAFLQDEICQCILRALNITQAQRCDTYGAVFKKCNGVPVIYSFLGYKGFIDCLPCPLPKVV